TASSHDGPVIPEGWLEQGVMPEPAPRKQPSLLLPRPPFTLADGRGAGNRSSGFVLFSPVFAAAGPDYVQPAHAPPGPGLGPDGRSSDRHRPSRDGPGHQYPARHRNRGDAQKL